jgi:hypothetical protein
VLVGLLAVLLVHLFLLATAPYLLRSDPVKMVGPRPATPRQFSIEIAPDAFTKPVVKRPPPTKYVEANPNAPDNAPDKTNNFSSRNSQLAQEKPQPDQHNDTPKLDGKKDIQSNQVVSGMLSTPQEVTTAPAPDPAKEEKPKTAARRAQDPLSGFEKSKEGDEGFGTNIGKTPDHSKPAPNKVEGRPDAPLVDGANDQPAIDPKHPRARPMINNLQTRPAIFRDNQFGTSNIGPVAYDARWSNYGAYLHRMIEAIQIQWDRILIESRTAPPPGSTVTVKFTLDSKGKITEIIDVESSSSEQGKQSCVSAITERAPYGDWTDDMIAVLGNSQELTFVFYYE